MSDDRPQRATDSRLGEQLNRFGMPAKPREDRVLSGPAPPQGGVDIDAPRFTREDLAARLNLIGHQTTARQLRSWVAYGIIPHPDRRARPDDPERRARALYPAWMFNALNDLLTAEAAGATVEELKELAPGRIRRARERAIAGAIVNDLLLDDEGRPTDPKHPRVPHGLRYELWHYAEQYQQRTGRPVQRMVLTMLSDDGLEVSIPIEPPPTPQPRPRGKFDHLFPDTRG